MDLFTFAANVALYSMLCTFAMCFAGTDFEKLASFSKLVVFASLLRLIWLVCEYNELTPSDNSCHSREWVLKSILLFSGQLSQLLFLTAFSALFFFWSELVLVAKRTTNLSVFNPSLVRVLFNLWIFVLWISLFLYRLFGKRNCEHEFDDSGEEEAAIASLFLILSVGFALVGCSLISLLRGDSISGGKMQFKIGMICACTIPLFVVKSVLMLQDPSGTPYPWLYFTLPEIVPSIVILYFMRKRRSAAIALEDAALLSRSDNHDGSANWRL